MYLVRLTPFMLTVLIFLMSCGYRQPSSSYQLTDKEKIVNTILFQTAEKLKKEKNLSPFGSGGQIMNGVKLLRLAFKYYKNVDIEEGRKLLMDAVTEFVSQINANEKVRPYLYRYPFKMEDVEIQVFLANPDGREVDVGKITLIVARRGLIKFEVKDPGQPFLQTIHHETLEEALQRVANPSAEPLELKPLPSPKLPEPGDKRVGIGFCE